jgi:hypothetical protein
MLLPLPKQGSEGLNLNVVSRMNIDDISMIARNDGLIVAYGVKSYAKTGHEQHTHQHISQKMRQLGRLVMKARELDAEAIDLKSVIQPRKFQLLVQSAKAVAGFQADTNTFDTPSLGLKLGHAVKKCAKILKSEAIQAEDSISIQRTDRFIQLCDLEWTDSISTSALKTLATRQWNKVKPLPLAKDIQALQMHMETKCLAARQQVKKSPPSPSSWQDLANHGKI